MKKDNNYKIIVVLLLCFSFFVCFNVDNIAVKTNEKKIIGSYILDINKTNLGKYAKDSVIYRNLQITFFPDSTFRFNMKVPFIYDSVGYWIAGGAEVESWNYLYYGNDRKISTQFSQPWTKDSIFYLNSTTPAKNEEFIQEIYFEKIFNH